MYINATYDTDVVSNYCEEPGMTLSFENFHLKLELKNLRFTESTEEILKLKTVDGRAIRLFGKMTDLRNNKKSQEF